MLLRVVIADSDLSYCKQLADEICHSHSDILSVDIATDADALMKKSIDYCASLVILNPAMPGIVEQEVVFQLKKVKKVCVFVGLLDDVPNQMISALFYMKLDDILLKSASMEERCACLNRARASLAQKRENTIVRDHYVLSKEFLLDRATTSFHKSTKIEDVNSRFATRFIPGSFQIILIRSDYKKPVQDPFYDDFPIRKKEMQIIRKHLNDYCSEFCVRYCINGLLFLINYPNGSEQTIRRQIQLVFEELSTFVKTLDSNLQVSICVGKPYSNIWQIEESREDAYRADWIRMGQGSGKLIFWEDTVLEPQDYQEKMDALTARAKRACTVLEVAEFDRCVEELFHLPNSILEHRQIRKWVEWFIAFFFECNGELLADAEDSTFSQSAIAGKLAYTKDIGEFFRCFQSCFDKLFYQALNISNRKSIRPVRVAMQYVHEHYMEQIRIESVAGYVNMSPSYFSTLFKKQTGLNFTVYVTNYRMQMAQKMLQETDMTIAEISDELGFSDQRYFSKTFKRSIGQTPGSYRKAKG